MGLQEQNTKKSRFFSKTRLDLKEGSLFVSPFRGVTLRALLHGSFGARVNNVVLSPSWE
jgi:hypothetical protein